jgi:hypothetical protein
MILTIVAKPVWAEGHPDPITYRTSGHRVYGVPVPKKLFYWLSERERRRKFRCKLG